MNKDLSELPLSVINLYEEFVSYLVDNKKIKPPKRSIVGKTRLDRKIKERCDSKTKFKEYINYFEYVLRGRFPKELLLNFEDNISDFKIYAVWFQLANIIKKETEYFGKYHPVKNIMIISVKDKESHFSIYHELFHLSSTNRMIIDRIQTGFYVHKKNDDIGYGLNEGYTDLLANRYFGNAGAILSYPLRAQYSYDLEQIVGRDRMEELYLTANPKQLVKDLERYETIDNIVYFFRLLDNINDPNCSLSVRNAKINDISRFLITWYTRKLFLNGENFLSPTVRNKINNYASLLPDKVDNLDGNGSIMVNLNAIIDDVIKELYEQNASMYRRAQ